MSTLREIADALADGLDAETFTAVGQQPAVERVNWPTYAIEDMTDPVIAVMPGTVAIERVDRTHHQYDYQATVFVGRHTPSDELADEMLDLAEEVADVIRAHVWHESIEFPTGVTSPVEVAIEINPDDALSERNVWRAVVTATYRVFR